MARSRRIGCLLLALCLGPGLPTFLWPGPGNSVDVLNRLDVLIDSPEFQPVAAYCQLAACHEELHLDASELRSSVMEKLHQQLRERIEEGLPSSDLVDLLSSAARLSEALPVRLVPALATAMASARVVEAPQLARTLWAAAQLQQVTEVLQVLPVLVAEMPSKAKEMLPQELADSLYSVAKLRKVEPKVARILPALVAEIPGKACEMQSQDLRNSLWASAKLYTTDRIVLKTVPVIATQVPGRLGEMIPKHVSNTLWAAAKLQRVVPKVLEVVPAIAERIVAVAGDMDAQSLSNSLWAAGQLRDSAPAVLQAVPALVEQFSGHMGAMAPQVLSNGLSALLALQQSLAIPELPGLVQLAATRLLQILPELYGKELSLTCPMVLWACARTGVEHLELREAVAQKFSKRQVARAKDWGLCALSRCYREGGLARRLEAEIARRRLRCQELLER